MYELKELAVFESQTSDSNRSRNPKSSECDRRGFIANEERCADIEHADFAAAPVSVNIMLSFTAPVSIRTEGS